MRTLRRLGFAFWLTRARLARRGGRLVLVGVGVAAAAAMLAAVLAGALAAQDRDVGKQVAAIDPASRSIHVTWFSVGGQAAPYRTLDAQVRRELGAVASRPPATTSLYRESQLGGAFLSLGAVDGLGRWVHVRSGRLPRPCTIRRCEVLVIRGGGRIPNSPGLRLVPVGRGDVVSPTLFGDAVPSLGLHQSHFVQESSRYHRPPPPPLVLANGVAGLNQWPALRDAYRTYSWVVPLDRQLVHSWSAGALAERIDRMRSRLEGEVAFAFTVEAPIDELRAASDSGRVVARRLFLLGGEAVALLLAFAVLAGARLRPDAEASRRRLLVNGVRRWQIWLQTVMEVAVPAVAGTLVGWVAGAAAALAVASRAGEPTGSLLRHSLLSSGGIAVGLLLAVTATVVLVLALTVRPFALRGFALTPLDVAALGAVAAVAIALARGAADAGSLLSQNGTGVVLLLLPVLVAFVAAVAVARLLPPALRGLERAVPQRWLSLRLASLALARGSGYAAVAAAFVGVSVGLALFAETYRWTLVRGQHDQAAFAVPADAVVSEDTSTLVPVRAAVPPALARSLGGVPVTRQGGTIEGAAGLGNVAVLGLDPATLRRIGGWRGDFASRSPSGLASAIAWHRPVGLRGARLPADATALVLPVRVRRTEIGVIALIRRPDGVFVPLSLGRADFLRAYRLVRRLPRAARGRDPRRAPLRPAASADRARGRPGRAGGGLGDVRAAARANVGRYRPGDRLRRLARDAGLVGVTPDAGGGIRFRLALSPQVDTYLRPRQPTDGLALPAVVSPGLGAIAGRNGVFGVNVAGQGLLFRAASVARRFPGATSADTSEFVVVDRRALQTALNASQPGAGFPTELWLDVPRTRRAAVAKRLRLPPFDVLSVVSRAEVERRLQRDPVARAAVAMLEAASLTAVVLALIGIGLGVVAERRDEAANLFDLEAEGLAPAALRRQLRLRALVVGLGGAAGGVLIALVLSALVVGFVELTANAGVPNPPLVLSVDWPIVLLAALAAAALATGVVALVTSRAFRGPAPARYGGSGA